MLKEKRAFFCMFCFDLLNEFSGPQQRTKNGPTNWLGRVNKFVISVYQNGFDIAFLVGLKFACPKGRVSTIFINRTVVNTSVFCSFCVCFPVSGERQFVSICGALRVDFYLKTLGNMYLQNNYKCNFVNSWIFDPGRTNKDCKWPCFFEACLTKY